MPRKIIASPKSDSVGSLLSYARNPFQVYKWKADELARQREQYAEDLKAQIKDKEAARIRENASSPRFAGEASEAASLPVPLPPDDTMHAAKAMDIHLSPIITSRPPLNNTLLKSAGSPRSAPASFSQQMSEKERFIASMEHGISRTPAYAHRSVNLPAPVSASVARAVEEEEKQQESAEALRRQQSFKADLELQIQEKKRQKALELEKEKNWAKEQEARLEKERAELRKEFEAEHAARRAKVEADAAENAAAMASRKATASSNLAKESNGDVKIYAPKRRNITSNKSPSPPLLKEVTNDGSVPQQDPQRTEENGSSSTLSSTAALDPNELSRKLQEMEYKFNVEEQPIPRRLNTNNITTSNLDGTPDSTAVSISAAHTAALAEQVEELKRLNESLQRNLSLHKTVLELVKDSKSLVGMQPPQQVPVYINPLALRLQTSLLQPAPAAAAVPIHAPIIRSLPIVYTASELRTEDSRPPTRMMAVTVKPKPAAPSTIKDVLQNPSNDGMIKAVRPGHQRPRVPPASSSLGPGTAAVETAQQRVSNREVAVVKSPILPPIEIARLPPARAAERLGIWKKAKLKLRKLSVSRAVGAKEATWVIKEESSAAMSPAVRPVTAVLQAVGQKMRIVPLEYTVAVPVDL